jgi:hypothetical protein
VLVKGAQARDGVDHVLRFAFCVVMICLLLFVVEFR